MLVKSIVRVAVLVAGYALAACGAPASEEASTNQVRSDLESTATPAANSGVLVVDRPLSGAGSRLTGQVSALTGDISDLTIRVTDTSTIVELPTDTLFEFDKATLTRQAAEQLNKTADLIRRAPGGAITIAGHTDSMGAADYNVELSRRRAEAVAVWFRSQPGVRKRDYRIMAIGEAQPIAPNTRPDGADNPEGRARNRRVEVIIPRG